MFPQLPRASMHTFRIGIAFGVGVVVALGLLRMFPLAVIAAAVIVPMLMVLYLVDVDVYEGEPAWVLAATMAWGLVAGVALGILGRSIEHTGASLLSESTSHTALLRGVLLPALAVLLSIAGPLLLLHYRKFNDVLDGTTFGVASAVALGGAQTITQASAYLTQAGLRPAGRTWPWILRLLELAVASPILLGAVAGAVCGAIWLRYRAPAREREALGAIGHPAFAVPAGLVLVMLGALAYVYIGSSLALIVYLVLDVVALIWLRHVLHFGLLEEAAEIEIGPEITCANCGATTPRHSFCSNCGISLLALPKVRS
jgi:hypothetical protein